MNPLFTPEQNKQLASWAGERDAILKVIGEKKTETETLTKTNNALADSNTEIANRIQQSIGRLEELDRQEINRATFVLKDVAALEDKKSILQTEVSDLLADIESLKKNKEEINKDIESITKTYESVFARAGEIERIVGNTATMSSTNAREISNILVEAKNTLKEVIEIGIKNVEMTNRTINQIPKIIVDIHRDVVERKKALRANPIK